MTDTIPKKKMPRKYSLAILTAIAAMAVSGTARAEGDVKIDWGRALVALDGYVRGGGERAEQTRQTVVPRADKPSEDPFVMNGGNAWAGVTPRVALVARDWGTQMRLAGDRLTLADAMRLSSSTRMVITRVRFGDARVRPFVQLGLGQWRTDRNLLPFTPRSTEIAGQAGGGIELFLTRSWQLAAESSVTALYREQRESDDIPQTRMWSATIASRIEF
jgi:hypothetical protein